MRIAKAFFCIIFFQNFGSVLVTQYMPVATLAIFDLFAFVSGS